MPSGWSALAAWTLDFPSWRLMGSGAQRQEVLRTLSHLHTSQSLGFDIIVIIKNKEFFLVTEQKLSPLKSIQAISGSTKTTHWTSAIFIRTLSLQKHLDHLAVLGITSLLLLAMDLIKFEDENSVQREADRILAKIFSDKSYSNPQKISLLLSEYEKKQVKLDSQLSKAIKAEIECIKQSKESVQEANNFMKEAEEQTDKMNELWQEKIQFHDFMEDIITLHVFQNNVGKVVEQLSYFIDMETEMQTLEKMAEDETKYLIVGNKLLNLIELRDALLDDSAWQRQTAVMRKEFIKVNNFETTFFDRIFLTFTDCIKYAKEKPETLKTAVKVIESYDKSLEAKGKERVMRERARAVIEESIELRFKQELADEEDLIGIIQKAKFTTKDLVDVNDYVQPCFPKEFPVMQIYQSGYQHHIETEILPYFDQIEEEKQYGHLVILLGWIDDYETMLSRAGVDSNNLANLKTKVKILMPFFIDHNRKIVEDYIGGALEEDKKKFTRKYYEQILRDGSDLISMFPSDIFRFINQEAEVIKDQLKGEIFIEFVRCITETVNVAQKEEVKQIEKEWHEDIKPMYNEDELVDFQYKVLLYINNYNECLKHAGESKQIFTEYVSEEFKSRIEKIFFTEVQKEFNQSIPKFISLIIQIIFMNVLKEHYPTLFTGKWLNDKSCQAMTTILRTVTTQLSDIESQSLIINIIHYRMVVKETLEYVVNAYIQQMIIFIKILYRANNNMEVRYCNLPATSKKIQQDPNADLKGVFNSRVAFTEMIKKDKQVFMKFADQFSECTSKTFMEKLKNKFTVLTDLFMKKGKDFEALPAKVADIFPEKASELLEAVLIVRDDVESRASSIPKRGMGYD